MTPKETALVIMAKMALRDGQVVEEERRLLAEMAGAGPDAPGVDGLLEAAAAHSLESLCAGLTAYEDRFFVALRAYMVARSDSDFADEERAFYQELVGRLEISAPDQKLIHRTEADLRATVPRPPGPRIEELYRNSSFCRAEAGS